MDGMKIRRYTAETTQEAIAKVRLDLGGDALIINTKKVRQKGLLGYFKKPMTEVMAAIDEQAQAKSRQLIDQVREYADSNRAALAQPALQPVPQPAASPARQRQQAKAAAQPAQQPALHQAPPYMSQPAQHQALPYMSQPAPQQVRPTAQTQPASPTAQAQPARQVTSQPARQPASPTAQAQPARQVTSPPARQFTSQPAPNDVFAQFQSQLAVSGNLPDGVAATAANRVRAIDAYTRDRPPANGDMAAEDDGSAERIARLETQIVNMESILSKVYREVSIASKITDGADEKPIPLTKMLSLLYNNLVRNEVEPEFSMNIVEKVGDAMRNGEGAYDAATAMYNEIASVLGTPETISLRHDKQPTVAIFVGPTGVGKTTTLAKIAANSALNQHLDVALITADTYRIAAVQQLKTYAEILGIPISVVYTPGEIKNSIAGFSDKDLILIDTAGRSYRNHTHFEELQSLVGEAGADEVFLVLSSTTSVKNNREIIRNYGFLNEFKLIFTKADESPVFGAMLNARMITGKCLSYVTVGQSVPDDIEVASVDKIARNLIGSIAE